MDWRACPGVLPVILIFSTPSCSTEGEIRMKNEGIIHHNQLYYRQGQRNKSVNTTEIFSHFKQLKYFYTKTIFIILCQEREFMNKYPIPSHVILLLNCTIQMNLVHLFFLRYFVMSFLFHWLTIRIDETVWLLQRLWDCRSIS